jgi:hypothetical protein
MIHQARPYTGPTDLPSFAGQRRPIPYLRPRIIDHGSRGPCNMHARHGADLDREYAACLRSDTTHE